jgi:chromosome segregation ATPase
MARQAKVTYQTPDGERREVFVRAGEEVSVGRHPQCTITISQPSVSRRHARMWLEGNAFYVEDTGSSNGTFVNNQRIQRAQLSDGDEIRCGDFRLAWRELPSSEPPAPAPAGPRLVGTLRPQRLPEGVAGTPRRTSSQPPAGPAPTVAPSSGQPMPLPLPRPVGNTPTQQARPAPPATPAPPPTPAPQPVGQPMPLPNARPLPLPTPQSTARPAPTAGPPTPMQRPAGGGGLPGVDLGAEVTRLKGEVDHWKGLAEARAGFENQVVTAAQTADTLRNEIELLRIQLERAKIEAATSVSDKGKAETDLTELRQDIQDKARRIAELERAVERGREQAETQAERSVQLTKQIQQQQAQLEEYRREKAELEVKLTEAQEKASTLGTSLSAGAEREGDLVNQVNDLKREVRQKEKAQKDVEKQLEVAEYNLRAARDENENLRLALGEDDGARKGLNTTVEHLRQVIAEKEAMIEGLQVEAARWQTRAEQKDGEVQAAVAEQTARARAEFLSEKENLLRQAQAAQGEIARLKEQLSGKGQADAAVTAERDALQRRVGELLSQVEALTQQINAVRTMHGAEIAALQAQVAAAQSAVPVGEIEALQLAHDAATAESTTLKVELARTQHALAEAQAAAASAGGSRGAQDQLNELKRTNRDLRNELEQLQAALAQAQSAPTASAGPSPAQTQELAEMRRLFEQAQSARRTAEVLKDRAEAEMRDLRDKLAAGASAVASASPAAAPAANAEYAALRTEAFKVYEDINDVASELKNNVELAQTYAADLRDGRDTAANLDATDEVLGTLKDAADTFKKTLRRFREVLQRHGYEG